MEKDEMYNELLNGIAELLKEKNFEIRLKNFEISELKAKLEQAEKLLAERNETNE